MRFSLEGLKKTLSVLLIWLLFVAPVSDAAIQGEWLFDLEASLSQPSSVRVSEKGMAYVLDGVDGRVVMFDQRGRSVGSFSAPEHSPLNLPMDLQLFEDKVIVADSGNHRLVVFSSEGDYLRSIPLLQNAKAFAPAPTGLAVIEGVVYWSDRANSQLCSNSLESGEELRCWGEFGSQEGEFRYPFMMTQDRDHYLHVVDVLNGRVQVFNERGRSFGALERFGVEEDALLRPNGISLLDEAMLVSDAYSGRILLFKGRSFNGLLADQNGEALQFAQPVGIAHWRDRLYVVEMERHRVRVYKLAKVDAESAFRANKEFFSQPTRRDCVTCHLSWSESYQPSSDTTDPVLPVGSHRMCMSCHHGAVIDSRLSLGQGEQHPDYYHPSKDDYFIPGEDREDEIPEHYPMVEDQVLYCGSCHTPHRFNEADTGMTHGRENLWMRDPNRQSEICKQCHDSLFAEGEEEARKRGVHPVSVDMEESVEIDGATIDRVSCESCHRVHGGEAESASLVVSKEKIGELCATCHQRHHADGLYASREKGVHPVNLELDEPVTIADRKISIVDCLSCHSVHGGVAHTPSLVEGHRDGQLCEACHEDAMALIDTDHDLRLTAKDSQNLLGESPEEAGVCGSCHSMHRGSAEHPYINIGDKLPEQAKASHIARDRLCEACHREEGMAEKHVVSDYSHPYKDLVMHSDIEQMPLLDDQGKSVESGEIACITCHDPHRWSPFKVDQSEIKLTEDQDREGSVLDSFLRQLQTEDGFCTECHGLETRIKYKYYHDKRSRPGRADYLK
ncbi:MAG: cytochrome c3 family protein [Candidatus Thiodiazotropha sp.]